jgi:hypothetical protein
MFVTTFSSVINIYKTLELFCCLPEKKQLKKIKACVNSSRKTNCPGVK